MALLGQLRRNQVPARGAGDPLPLPSSFARVTPRELEATFGPEFVENLAGVTRGQWEGPVESGYGLHLVKVTRREDSRIPEWTEVRERIVTDMRFEGRKAAEDQFYAEILPRYRLVFSEGLDALLERSDG